MIAPDRASCFPLCRSRRFENSDYLLKEHPLGRHGGMPRHKRVRSRRPTTMQRHSGSKVLINHLLEDITMRSAHLVLGFAGLGMAIVIAHAQTSGDPERGYGLAQRFCAECHAVGK